MGRGGPVEKETVKLNRTAKKNCRLKKTEEGKKPGGEGKRKNSSFGVATKALRP